MRVHKAGGAMPPIGVTGVIGIIGIIGLSLTATLAGCGRHSSGSAATGSGDGAAQGSDYQSQAERTKAMEAKAHELDQKAAEIQNMQGTEQEKIDAVNKLEQERQELNKMGGDSSTPAPPPQ